MLCLALLRSALLCSPPHLGSSPLRRLTLAVCAGAVRRQIVDHGQVSQVTSSGEALNETEDEVRAVPSLPNARARCAAAAIASPPSLHYGAAYLAGFHAVAALLLSAGCFWLLWPARCGLPLTVCFASCGSLLLAYLRAACASVVQKREAELFQLQQRLQAISEEIATLGQAAQTSGAATFQLESELAAAADEAKRLEEVQKVHTSRQRARRAGQAG